MTEDFYRTLYLSYPFSCQEAIRNLRWIDKYILTENLWDDIPFKKLKSPFLLLTNSQDSAENLNFFSLVVQFRKFSEAKPHFFNFDMHLSLKL